MRRFREIDQTFVFVCDTNWRLLVACIGICVAVWEMTTAWPRQTIWLWRRCRCHCARFVRRHRCQCIWNEYLRFRIELAQLSGRSRTHHHLQWQKRHPRFQCCFGCWMGFRIARLPLHLIQCRCQQMVMPNSIGATVEFAKLVLATLNQALMPSTMNAIERNRRHPRTIETRSCQNTHPKPIWRPKNSLPTQISAPCTIAFDNNKLTRTKSKQSPVILRLLCPTFTVYLYSPSDASLVDRLCNSTAFPVPAVLMRDLCPPPWVPVVPRNFSLLLVHTKKNAVKY